MATQLLNPDGSASMATAFLSAHHGFRRDIALFVKTLPKLAAGAVSNVPALQEEWQSYRTTLHHHHTIEDQSMFPGMRTEHPECAGAIDQLGVDHTRIDPLLERGDKLFATLPGSVNETIALVKEIAALLDTHLALEEATVVQWLRDAKGFPPPSSDAEVELYAQGFSWSCHGIAPSVLEPLFAMLPPALLPKLPAAREAFAQRCERVWGTREAGASTTSVPDWLKP